jgi:hypothetical protein
LQKASSFMGSLSSFTTHAATSAFATLTTGGGGGAALAMSTSSIPVVALGIMGVFGAATLGLAGVVYFNGGTTNIDDKLNNLGSKRTQLNKELEKQRGSMNELKVMLEKKKAKISRLENALVNPNQQ